MQERYAEAFAVRNDCFRLEAYAAGRPTHCAVRRHGLAPMKTAKTKGMWSGLVKATEADSATLAASSRNDPTARRDGYSSPRSTTVPSYSSIRRANSGSSSRSVVRATMRCRNHCPDAGDAPADHLTAPPTLTCRPIRPSR